MSKTDDEIVKEIAQAIGRGYDSDHENEWAEQFADDARTAFAVAYAALKERHAGIADGINQLGGSAHEVAAAIRQEPSK